MSKSLNIKTDRVETAIQRIRTEIDHMVEVQQTIAAQNENMVRNWDGHSGNGFLQVGVSLEKAYNDVIEEMKSEVDLLERYNLSIQATEANAVDQSGLLDQ